MRIFISTGEVSGDLQGSLLIEALKRCVKSSNLSSSELRPDLEIIALGGEKMAAAGARLLGDTVSIGSFGFVESLSFVLPTLKIQRQAKRYLKENPPDVVVLIDYMGPNLAIGDFMRRHLPNVPVVYYIAPQFWVASMNSGYAKRIINVSDRLLAIFPGEADYFRGKGANVSFVGHPLVDRMKGFPSREEARGKLGMNNDNINIGLLPASRKQEIKHLLPIIFQAAQELQNKLPQVKFWIPLSLEIYRQDIEKAIQKYGLQATIVSGQKEEVLSALDLAITKCGTVNLELGLLNIPQIVVYRLNSLTYWIGTKILKIKYPFASPVNLLVMHEIIPELIQEKATSENITQAAMEFLFNPERQQQLKTDYLSMQQKMGQKGVCDRAAKEILQMIPN
ncbi:MAG: lipid-A-disaccharide synthase [Cyanobacteria bacterium P01_A01_bin.84]